MKKLENKVVLVTSATRGIGFASDDSVYIAGNIMEVACGKCSRVCPMQLTPYLEFDENNQFSNENCINCSTCVVNCPAKILSLDTKKESINKTKKIESKHDL